MFRICKTMKIETSHFLKEPELTKEQNFKIFGKCTRFHGHSYKVEVFYKGEELTYGMLMNFSSIKEALLKNVYDKYDHSTLNDVVVFNPTAENLAKSIYKTMRGLFIGLPLEKVRVWETETCWAEYYE